MIYYEDMQVGERSSVGEYPVTKEEIIEFGKRWDQSPYHVDEELARDSIFGGLVAPGAFIMAIQTCLLHRHEVVEGEKTAALGRLGTDELRFRVPVRPGDRISLEIECIHKRESQSKPDRGVVTHAIALKNQKDEVVMTLKDTILVAKRLA